MKEPDHTPRPWTARYLDEELDLKFELGPVALPVADYVERLESLAAKINASIAAVRDSSTVWRIKESKDEEIRRLDKELAAEREKREQAERLPFPARIGTLEEMEGDRELEAELAAAVDAWHPASQPPTPEDFEPTGKIDVVTLSCAGQRYNSGLPDYDYWRKITPPKP